ncbi:uncharacterized protein CEXT_685531 [Caerostris extrusa]|uniref:BACK domain-containing protein n=1 Tax=Caerostris extrusa TaxID=172846 RepID=A0AAV4T728_CAEEX|nr:uncharacterized protein CEXT_685531 [Caerostris extrusa]
MLFVERFWKNLARGGGSDVGVITEFNGNVVRFPCHKRILSRASDIFKKELSSKRIHCIRIADVEPNIVFFMLRLFEISVSHSIKELYSISLGICVTGAFYVLDSEEFNRIKPSTVISIASHPFLNVPNEAYVFYSLWIRATVDICRNNLELNYDNMVKYFEPYSVVIEYRDITEEDLGMYKNEYLMQYYRNVSMKRERIYPVKRGMKFPLKLPLKYYIHYNSSEVVSINSLQDKSLAEFSVRESAYLIDFTIVGCCVPNESNHGLESMWIEDNHKVLFKWNKEDNNSQLKLKLHKQVAYMSDEEVNLQVFQFIMHDLIKLCSTTTYYMKIKTSNTLLLWPEFRSKNNSNSPLQIHTNTHKCLKAITFLPCPSIYAE